MKQTLRYSDTAPYNMPADPPPYNTAISQAPPAEKLPDRLSRTTLDLASQAQSLMPVTRSTENAGLRPEYSDRLQPPEANQLSFLGTVTSTTDVNQPIVIPQITKSFRGAFWSPFARAYPPALASKGIHRETFLQFMDDVNEAFVVSPAFRAVAMVGMGMSFVPLLSVSAAGMGLQTAAGVASAGVSYARTRSLIKSTNRELFRPAGYTCTVLSTKKMMAKIGMEGETLKLPPLSTSVSHSLSTILDTNSDVDDDYLRAARNNTPEDDPRMRRLRAMQGYIQPLEFENSPMELPENILKRWNAKNARRLDAKQNEKLMKARRKADDEREKNLTNARDKARESQRKIIKVEEKIGEKEGEYLRRMERAKSNTDKAKLLLKEGEELEKLEQKKMKIVREQDKEVQKHIEKSSKRADKVERKEHKIAQKIRWIVIIPWNEGDGEGNDDVVETDPSEAEAELEDRSEAPDRS